MRYLLLKSILPFFLLGVLFAACRKESIQPETRPERIKRPHGATIGTPDSKTIGPEGGLMQSTDGTIEVTVPAGAVATATAFKIQRVENTLPGSQGPAYRLLPDDVKFAKPVTIRFSYASINLPAKLLALAYQDKDGYYHRMNKTERNTAAKTLTVQSTHFSDWLIFNFIGVTPTKATLKKDETVELTLYQSPVAVEENPIIDESDIIAAKPYEKPKEADWYKSPGGVGGILVSSGSIAQYTAPAATGVQYVVCKVDNVMFNNENLGQVQFITEMTVTGSATNTNSPAASYIHLIIDGDTSRLTYNIAGSFYDNTFISGSFTANPYDIKQMNIQINDRVQAGSVYRYDDMQFRKSAQINIGTGYRGTSLQTSYALCNSTTRRYSPDSIKITKAGPVGDFVEGEFYGVAYSDPTICPNPGLPAHQVPISGYFKIYRGF